MTDQAIYKAIAAHQDSGNVVAIIDYEDAFDPELAKLVGIDLESLLVASPESLAEGLEIVKLLRQRDVLIFSLADLPDDELELEES